MSIKSTHDVTREFAIQVITMKLMALKDRQLELILEECIHNGFYNFSIVESIKESNFYLDDLNNLPEYNDAW